MEAETTKYIRVPIRKPATSYKIRSESPGPGIPCTSTRGAHLGPFPGAPPTSHLAPTILLHQAYGPPPGRSDGRSDGRPPYLSISGVWCCCRLFSLFKVCLGPGPVWAQGSFELRACLGPALVWAQGPFGARARLGPGPIWSQGLFGPRARLDPGPIRAHGPIWLQGGPCLGPGPMGTWA